VFGGIRRLFNAQAERLSPMERDVLTRLAIEREPISVAALLADRLVETVADEIRRGEPIMLVEQPLIKAQAKDYVRQTQERLICAPIVARLNAQLGETGTKPVLLALLDAWRGRPAAEQGYGPGNVVNLVRLLRGNLRGTDLSRLVLRQVYLQGVDTQDASLAGAGLVGTVLDEPFAYPTSVALSADGAFLVAGTPSGEVRLWRAADRTLLVAARRHTGMVWSVAVSADGQHVASGGDDGTVRLREVEGGQLLATLQGHTGLVWGMALSADKRLVVSGGMDGTVRLWEAESGHLLATLQGHTGPVLSVALSADGRLVASSGADGTVRLWEAGSGQLLATLQGHTGAALSVALTPFAGRASRPRRGPRYVGSLEFAHVFTRYLYVRWPAQFSGLTTELASFCSLRY
jgi:hypothetical protein